MFFCELFSICVLYAQNLSFGGKYLETCFVSGDKGLKRVCQQRRFACKLRDLSAVQERFKEVLIDNLDYLKCIEKYDCPTTLFYCDPPYDVQLSSTYKQDWTTEDTERLVDVLCNLKGSCVMTCYDGDRYKKLIEHGYSKVDFQTYSSVNASGHKDQRRVETAYYRVNR